jgi:hypothetical protein
MLPDGRVVLCSMDYGLKHVLENLFVQDCYDLFQSDKICNVQMANMSLDASIKVKSFCTSCENVFTYTVYFGACYGGG